MKWKIYTQKYLYGVSLKLIKEEEKQYKPNAKKIRYITVRNNKKNFSLVKVQTFAVK